MGKFLILNPNFSNLDEVLTKSNTQNDKNGPFNATILLGDVLPKSSNLPKVDICSRTYFTQGLLGLSEEISQKDDEIVNVATNLTLMKPHATVLTLKSGQTLLFITAEGQKNQEYTRKVINDNKKQIDILITHDWPKTISNQKNLLLIGDRFVDEIVNLVTPRYHFSHGSFFENKPFKWDNGIVTRFISLGEEGSGDKWFYAFVMDLTISDTDNLIENPFTKKEISSKRSLLLENQPVIKKQKVVTPDECFFCLSNPKVETHMIISIGTYAYLTIAKGPLTRSNKYLPFSGHAIIIPIEHIPTIRLESSNITDSPVYQEIQKFHQSLVKSFIGNKVQFKLIFFEIDLKSNIHKHIQVLPIPDHFVEKFESNLYSQAESNNTTYKDKNHSLHFKKYINDQDEELLEKLNTVDHMTFTLYHNETEKTIYLAELDNIDKIQVDLQFPRRVLSNVLHLRKRIYWANCTQPQSKETLDCENFKEFYKQYDFTIQK